MEQSAMKYDVFTPTQLHILQFLQYCNTQESLDELDAIISKFYEEKLQVEADRLWDNGTQDLRR